MPRPQPRAPRAVSAASVALLVLLALHAALAPRAAAQMSSVASKGLTFGGLVPGVTRTIQPTEPDAARWTITVTHPRGSQRGNVRFTLPSAMSRSGTLISLGYGPGMARVVNGDGSVTTFDPAVGLTDFLFRGTATVYLGGRATPAGAQRAGAYAGNLTMVVLVP